MDKSLNAPMVTVCSLRGVLVGRGAFMKSVNAGALLLGAALSAWAASPASAASYLQNGSFETGDFSGWTTGGNFEFSQVVTGASYVYPGAQAGNFYATFGPVEVPDTISQTFIDTPGEQLRISGWLFAAADNPSRFTLTFNGTQLSDDINPDTGGSWSSGQFFVTATGNDTITLAFRDDPGFIALDNLAVESTSATPLPAALPMFIGGAGLIGLLARRRKQKRAA